MSSICGSSEKTLDRFRWDVLREGWNLHHVSLVKAQTCLISSLGLSDAKPL